MDIPCNGERQHIHPNLHCIQSHDGVDTPVRGHHSCNLLLKNKFAPMDKASGLHVPWHWDAHSCASHWKSCDAGEWHLQLDAHLNAPHYFQWDRLLSEYLNAKKNWLGYHSVSSYPLMPTCLWASWLIYLSVVTYCAKERDYFIVEGCTELLH